MDEAAQLQAVQPIAATWKELEAELRTELQEEGFREDQISVSRVVYMKYYGQLDDVEVDSPVASLDTADDMRALFRTFEDLYAKMFTLAARPDVSAYHVTEVCVIAKVDTVKPRLRRFELGDPIPSEKAFKCKRPVFMRGKWHDADIWEMESLVPGNEIEGLAVIEASNTTLLVPPEWHVRIDEYDIYWLTRRDA
jgi:N-methylhydantoinase A/oxoprolinase/acetone carboxylase beta subunit